MQTLYRIAINNVGQMSVDVFSDRRAVPNKWRAYFCVTPATAARFRRVYLKYRKACYVSHEWSPQRWRMYRDWRKQWGLDVAPGFGFASLDHLETSSGEKPK